MMFDPPDYPFKELAEVYDPENLLFNHDLESTDNSTSAIKTTLNSNVAETHIYLHSNDSGRYFSIEGSNLIQAINKENAELYVIQPDSLCNYEPNLLDENTVNQFLLPLQETSNKSNQNSENTGPDLLALHSCVICHEIFTTESDLLDHTIALHASVDEKAETEGNEENNIINNINKYNPLPETSDVAENSHSNVDSESEWLVCRICQRVLSTALEVQPSEPLCCVDTNGKGSTLSRKLLTMFVCDLCSGLFADGDALDRHRLTCFIEEPDPFDEEAINNCTETNPSRCPEICFSCDICGKQYSSTDELKLHSLEFHRPISTRNTRRTYTNNGNSKMWNCGSCNQLFATARELYRHKRGEDRPEGAPLKTYVCDHCDKVLGSLCALHTHKKMHKITKPGYPCQVCGRRFNQSGHLAIHMRMHTGERPYPCDLCPKAFKVKVERDDHRRTHTGERPFACAACPKTFTAAARLREHARIHTDQRPYRCEICDAAFRRPYARTVHTLIHTGEKPHECDICGTAFRRSGDMWKHKRTLHGVHPEIEIKKTYE